MRLRPQGSAAILRRPPSLLTEAIPDSLSPWAFPSSARRRRASRLFCGLRRGGGGPGEQVGQESRVGGKQERRTRGREHLPIGLQQAGLVEEIRVVAERVDEQLVGL